MKTANNLTKAYENFLEFLCDKNTFRTFSVAEFYCDKHGIADPKKINIVLRIDVDNGLHLCIPLAMALRKYGLQATFFFLTHPDRYYNIWDSGITRKVAQLGFEIGIHSDHYFEQITKRIDGLSKLKSDIKRLEREAGVKIRGMVSHGHPEINAMGKKNWDLTKDVSSQELGLDYHDGLLSCYIEPGSTKWNPKCDVCVSDFMGVSNSWGWNCYPEYPLRQLEKAKPGQVVHTSFHVKNAYHYWQNWDESFGESPLKKINPISFFYKTSILKFRYKVLKGHTFKRAILKAGFKILSIFLAKGIGFFWPRPQNPDRDSSWETGRKRIYDLGIPYWHNHLKTLGMIVPGGKVLEIGSGNGQWLIAYAQDAAEVIGIEPAALIREFSLKKISEYPNAESKIKVIGGAAEYIPFYNNYFDRVFCSGVFMFTRQELSLKEMGRVLKPGGKLCLIANGLGYFIMNIVDGFRYKNVKRMNYGLSALFVTLLKWWFKKELSAPKAVNHREMKKLCSKYGLELYETKLFLSQNQYPKRHLGFSTNYAFLIRK